jgi:hypothetical protein
MCRVDIDALCRMLRHVVPPILRPSHSRKPAIERRAFFGFAPFVYLTRDMYQSLTGRRSQQSLCRLNRALSVNQPVEIGKAHICANCSKENQTSKMRFAIDWQRSMLGTTFLCDNRYRYRRRNNRDLPPSVYLKQRLTGPCGNPNCGAEERRLWYRDPMRPVCALCRPAATVPIPKEGGEMKNTRACRTCGNENAEGWKLRLAYAATARLRGTKRKGSSDKGTEIPAGTAMIANPKEGVGIMHQTSGHAPISTLHSKIWVPMRDLTA